MDREGLRPRLGFARIRAAGSNGADSNTGSRLHCSLNFYYCF